MRGRGFRAQLLWRVKADLTLPVLEIRERERPGRTVDELCRAVFAGLAILAEALLAKVGRRQPGTG